MGHFHLSKNKNNLRPGQNLVPEIDWIGTYLGPGQIVQNNPRPGLYGAFLPLNNIRITQVLSQSNKRPRAGKNLVLKKDWTGTYF